MASTSTPQRLQEAIRNAVRRPDDFWVVLNDLRSGALVELMQSALDDNAIADELVRGNTYEHIDGFYRVPLPGGDGDTSDRFGRKRPVRLRLTIWDRFLERKRGAYERPHNHGFDPRAFMISGGYVAFDYDVRAADPADKDADKWMAYQTYPRLRGELTKFYDPLGEVTVTPNKATLSLPGSYWSSTADCVHRVTPMIPSQGDHSISLFYNVGFIEGGKSMVMSKVPIPEQLEYEQFDRGKVQDLIARVLPEIANPPPFSILDVNRALRGSAGKRLTPEEIALLDPSIIGPDQIADPRLQRLLPVRGNHFLTTDVYDRLFDDLATYSLAVKQGDADKQIFYQQQILPALQTHSSLIVKELTSGRGSDWLQLAGAVVNGMTGADMPFHSLGETHRELVDVMEAYMSRYGPRITNGRGLAEATHRLSRS